MNYLSPGQLLSNRYWIRHMLGQGGMGAVYEGWDARLRIRCAIKGNVAQSKESRIKARVRLQVLP